METEKRKSRINDNWKDEIITSHYDRGRRLNIGNLIQVEVHQHLHGGWNSLMEITWMTAKVVSMSKSGKVFKYKFLHGLKEQQALMRDQTFPRAGTPKRGGQSRWDYTRNRDVKVEEDEEDILPPLAEDPPSDDSDEDSDSDEDANGAKIKNQASGKESVSPPEPKEGTDLSKIKKTNHLWIKSMKVYDIENKQM